MTATPAAPTSAAPLRTPSLRWRVTWMTLGLLTVLLVVLALTLDTVLSVRLEAQLRDRLLDRASIGRALADQVDTRSLVERLEGEGIAVRAETTDGDVLTAGGPPTGGELGDGTAPATPATPGPPGPGGAGPGPTAPGGPDAVVETADYLSVSEVLEDGTTLQLYADRAGVDDTLGQVRTALLISALLVLAAAALALVPVVGRALAPVGDIAAVARDVRDGDRGRRLRADRPGTELGSMAVAFDDMLDALEGAERDARRSEARLRDFVSDAAHELRTPVTGIRATSEHLLRTDPDRAERERLLLVLTREADRAGRLVDDLLLMARIDRGLEIVPSRHSLRTLAEHAVEARAPVVPEARLTVEGPDVLADVDADRISQVLGNLLDNALRAAGPTGTVTVRLTAAGPLAHLDVLDDGPGVPAHERERIFDRLVRLDDARGRGSAGSGLGLPIARGIARAHGGDLVHLDDPRRAGACFRLTLPRVSDPRA